MNISNFSINRNITDYSIVQSIISRIIRNKKVFIKYKELDYLNIGCGPNTYSDMVNLDYWWHIYIDVCWDLTKKTLPFESESFKGVFTEHCFEHIPFESFKDNMKRIYQILKPNGTLRLIMPDGELYLDIYNKRKNGDKTLMPYEEGYISTMHRINGLFREHGHLFIYDFNTVSVILNEIGFKNIKKEKFESGRDKMLIRDTEFRSIESLYVEATK